MGSNTVRGVGRQLEDVEYWRKRAGWFDDDVTMKDYNSGVSSSYYAMGDDNTKRSSSSSGFLKGQSGAWIIAIKIGLVIISCVICVYIFRAATRKSSDSKERSSSSRLERGEDASRRSRSKSASGRSSRSRSSSKRPSSDYNLVDDDVSRKSGKSSRSRSRRRSRSRTSSSRSKRETEVEIV
jgi:hypothetical protein